MSDSRRQPKFGLSRSRSRRLFAVLAVVALVSTACATGEDTDSSAPTEDTEDEATGTGAADDRVVFALTAPTAETNRAWAVALSGLFQIDPVLETLISIDPETGVPDAPGLAEDWEVSSDTRTWRFFLRQGVQFHDGWGEFTAADVLHSRELQIQEESIGANKPKWEEATVTAVNDYEVVFEFETPQPDGGLIFSNAIGELYIYSKAQFDEEGVEGIDEQPAGTGYFTYKGRTLGESITYEAYDSHWSGNTPDFGEMEIRWVPEDSTRLAMLLAGEADIAEVSLEAQKQAAEQGMEIIQSTGAAMQTFLQFDGLYFSEGYEEYLNDEFSYTQDVRVRQALNKAINKEEMIEFIYDGDATIVHRLAFLPQLPGWNPEFEDRYDEMYGYDPERAVELIREAGYEPEDLEYGIYGYTLGGQPEIPLVAEAIQQYFSEIGINAYIIEDEYAVARADIRAFASNGQLFPLRNGPIRPASTYANTFHNSKTPAHPIYYSNELDGLIGDLNAAQGDERDDAAREVGNYLYENFTDIPLVAKTRQMTVNPERISGWTYPGTTELGTTHFHLVEAAG